MLYEWYSGSDEDDEVPRRIATILDDEDGEPSIESVRALEALLDRERDANWRGFIQTMIGARLNRAGEIDDSVQWFLRARDTYEPLSRNFPDVVSSYCRTLYCLIVDHYLDQDGPEGLFTAALTILVHFGEIDFDEFERALVLQWLKGALDQIGHATKNSTFYEAGLGVALAMHHADSDDPGMLESLLYSFHNCDDSSHAREVFRMYLERSNRDEFRDRVLRFAKENGITA